MWHAAWVALSGLMLLLATRSSVWSARLGIAGALVTSAAGSIHGFTFFLVTAEGGTAGFGIPASLLFLAWSAAAVRRGSRHPVFVFILVSSVATLALDLAWVALNGGRLVEPCSILGC
jgi:hypothetical protein